MSSATQQVLFIDDDVQATSMLIQAIEKRGPNFNCIHANTAEEALELTNSSAPRVIVLDLNLSPEGGPESGLSLIPKLLTISQKTKIIVLTGHGDEAIGIKAVENGAASFLVKPVETSHLISLISDAFRYATLRDELQTLRTNGASSFAQLGLSTRSSKMEDVFDQLLYVSATNQPVLLTGETGTGKTLLAKLVHKASEHRRGGFYRFHASYTSSDLVSSELFGHTRGAFTGAADDRKGLIAEADKGTLFIDEVDELPQETQVLLLHVLQEKVFRKLGSNRELSSDFRLITATNRPVNDCLSSGKLREDFFHRIAHVTIKIPSLRERAEDIPLLVETFCEKVLAREQLTVQAFSEQALATLQSYSWPGNVRELQAVVEGALYHANYLKQRFVEPENIRLPKSGSSELSGFGSFREMVKRYEERLVTDALRSANSNQTKAAELLQMDRTSLRRILGRITND